VKVRFLEIAEIELDDAIRWYEAQAHGLGDALLVEVLSAAQRIMLYPDAWQSLDDSVRRCRLSRFPYGLVGALASLERALRTRRTGYHLAGLPSNANACRRGKPLPNRSSIHRPRSAADQYRLR
jgi:toxin ParE2